MQRVYVHRALIQEIVVNTNDNFYLEIEVVNEDCTPFDLMYYEAFMRVVNKWQNFEVLTPAATITGTNTVVLEAAKEDMQLLNNYTYEFEIWIEKSDEYITLRKGDFKKC